MERSAAGISFRSGVIFGINDLDEGTVSNVLKFADDPKIFEEVRDTMD